MQLFTYEIHNLNFIYYNFPLTHTIAKTIINMTIVSSQDVLVVAQWTRYPAPVHEGEGLLLVFVRRFLGALIICHLIFVLFPIQVLVLNQHKYASVIYNKNVVY